MNRHLRRLERFRRSMRSQGEIAARPPKEPDPRAKSTGHGKHTADKWNQ